MELPHSLRDELVEELDDYLEALDDNAEAEALAEMLVELLEAWADEEGFDELVSTLEYEGALDGKLVDLLEAEIESNDELASTGEELVSILEQLCGIEWDLEGDEEDEDDEDEDDEDDLDLE